MQILFYLKKAFFDANYILSWENKKLEDLKTYVKILTNVQRYLLRNYKSWKNITLNIY